MASSESVLASLKEILGQVVDCPSDQVVLSARLGKDLGVDSLSMIEVCEKLGVTFDRYITDDAINDIVTVQDAVNAIVHHDGSTVGLANPALLAAEETTGTENSGRDSTLFEHLNPAELEEKKRDAWGLVTKMAVAGLAIGVVLGLGGAMLIQATGIDELQPLPSQQQPVAAPTASASPSEPAPTPTPTPSQTTEPADDQATLSADPSQVSPRERIKLSGTFPELGKGALLQVQVKDPGSDWDDFPVTTRSGTDGKFRTYVFTSREGEQIFRLINPDSGKTTPPVTVTIG